jgi:hypothetical protein
MTASASWIAGRIVEGFVMSTCAGGSSWLPRCLREEYTVLEDVIRLYWHDSNTAELAFVRVPRGKDDSITAITDKCLCDI